MKVLISILSSFNEYILYETYNSIKNQENTKINFDIKIVVNSLNKNYYNDVKRKFENINVEIIETESNGKPGMGHNSCLELFSKREEYDYLIPIDGDDFLYPYALKQIEKLLIYNPDIIVGGNEDVISNYKELYNKESSIYLTNKYFLNIEPNILIKKEFMLGKKGTPCRLLLINRKILNYKINEYYCSKCKVFDDYLFYLHVLNLHFTTNMNIYFISLKNIYIYYKAHISSVCYENSNDCDDNLNKLEEKFPLLIELSKKIKLKLSTLYVNNINNEIIEYKYENNKNINYEINDFLKSEQFKMNLNFNLKLSERIYNSTLEFIYIKLDNINNLDIKTKKRIYLLLENLILNEIYNIKILKNLIKICNNLNYISIDIIDIIISNININEYYELDYIEYYNREEYIISILKIKYIIRNKDIDNINSLYYYFNIICNKLGLISYEILENNINIKSSKDTIIFLDTMNIDYNCNTPYIKGLGGTQLSYIFLAIELTKKYNIIILNKKKSKNILLNNDIYFISYSNINEMLLYINKIHPNIVIYNFIEMGKILKENIKDDILIYMYEHITIYSYFEMKKKQDYYNYYDKIIFVSNNQKNEYLKYVKLKLDKISINYNGLSPIFYHNNLNNNILENKELSIIYISNPQRGLINFLYIFPMLKKKYKNIKLNIYSSLDMYDIEDNEDLKNLYKELEIMEDVNYNKTISQKELIKELNKSLLFIYPTNMTETFCNSMIEAMSCGCYIISNNVGALKEVGNPYGYFIDIEIKENEKPPYENFMKSEYLNEMLEVTSNVIDKYLIKCDKLNKHLLNQIEFVKEKYKWNKNIFNK